MMRSLYAGVAGLQNHQVRMDVIGNNIANVNTTGFKKGRVNFQDMLSQTMSGAARPNEEVGGVNPKQIGLGMTVATIDTIHTQGSLQTTGVMTDLALQGNGFFMLKSGNKEYYTRNGAFGIDENGTLMNPANGLRVQGWQAQLINGNPYINTSGEVGDLKIPVGGKDPAKATANVQLACNLNKNTPLIPEGAGPEAIRQGTWTVRQEIYDSFGVPHVMQIEFTKTANPNQWQARVIVDPDAATPTNTVAGLPGQAANGNTFLVNFSNLGTLQSIAQGNNELNVANADLNVQLTFAVPNANPENNAPRQQTFNLNLGRQGSVVNSVTQFAEASSTKAIKQDGYTMGYLDSFKIDQSGVITGVYSNGSNRVLGQVALATFTNPGGLEKSGENNYEVSNNSGQANIGPSGIAGKGKVIAGALEMSNVDLSEAFTDMIVTQRGFQANSKTIQTADQMLQELLTLKR